MAWWHQYRDAGGPVRLRTLVEPAEEPVTQAEARDHLHLTESSEQGEVDICMTAARAVVEGFSGRRIIRQKVRQSLDCFPYGKQLDLAASPLFPNSTASPVVLRYYPQNSTSSTAALVFPSSRYIVSRDSDPPRIVVKRDGEFPTLELRNADAVEVEYWVGYSTSSTAAPAWARMATLLLGAHYFANREAVIAGTIVNKVPMSARSLMFQHRSPLAMI